MATLKDLCTEAICMDFRLAAGKNGLNNPVYGVHMIENPEISRFLNGNEVVFVTGSGLNQTFTLLDLIQSFKRQNCSGIFINIGPYIPNLPPQVIEFCNQQNLPLFIIPWEIRMAEIMRVFCIRIAQCTDRHRQLFHALKTALYFPRQEESYLPEFEANGLRTDLNFCVCLMELSHYKNHPDDSAAQYQKLKTVLDALLFHTNIVSYIFPLDQYLLLLFADTPPAEIDVFLKKAIKSYQPFLKPGMCLYIGLSAREKGAARLSSAYEQAGQVLYLQKRRGARNEVLSFEKLGCYKILFNVKETQTLKNYFSETLGDLVKYDKLNRTAYCKLLNIYLQNNGSIKRCAQILSIHKNTALYRIHKIEEILQCDLSDLKTRLDCRLAFMIKDLL